jgi:putative endonuclease
MYYVYVLISAKDKRFYMGCTNNLKKRLNEHNNQKVFSTKNRIPLKLIYCEICLDKHDAFIREKYLKTAWGKRYIKNRLKTFLYDYLTG